MPKHCAACGSADTRISLGSVLLCSDCAPAIREEMEKLRSDGKPVDVSRIASRMLQGQSGNLMIRNVPDHLLQKIGYTAVDRRCSKRLVVIEALKHYFE